MRKFCNDGCKESYHEDRRQGLIYGSMAVRPADVKPGMLTHPIPGDSEYVLVGWEDGCRIEGSCCYCRTQLRPSIRPTRILIRIEFLNPGYTAYPVSKHWRKRFADYMRQWGDYTEKEACQVYFQGDYELPEEVTRNRQYRDLQAGWDITILVDPWEFGHWLGWDAHTITEGKR